MGNSAGCIRGLGIFVEFPLIDALDVERRTSSTRQARSTYRAPCAGCSKITPATTTLDALVRFLGAVVSYGDVENRHVLWETPRTAMETTPPYPTPTTRLPLDCCAVQEARTGVGVSCSPAASDGTCEAACACRIMRAHHSSANNEVFRALRQAPMWHVDHA